jgi:hypothetical protein
MADNPVWVIPAITASASLLGTIVGGLVAYWTSSTGSSPASSQADRRETWLCVKPMVH